MQFKYLEEWVNKASCENLIVKNIATFRDQIMFFFKKKKKILQINLSSENSFCFFYDNLKIPKNRLLELSPLENILNYAKLKKISLVSNDRIIAFVWEKVDIFNQRREYSLIIELIPRFQNIIVIDQNSKIVYTKKTFSFADNIHRQVLVGVKYQPPQTDFNNLSAKVEYPVSFKKKCLIESSNDDQSYKTINELFYFLYFDHILKKQLELQRNKIIVNISKEIKKQNRTIEKLKRELNDAEKKKKWLNSAELLKSSLGKLKKGINEIEVTDYFQEDFPKKKIEIFPDKTPQQNLDFYYKKYRKARDGKAKILKRIQKINKEIDELTKEKFDVHEADIFDLIPASKKTKTNVNRQISRLKSLKINNEWEIFIGRTSKENDFLTTKFSKPFDWWFHTRVFRGTHIILRNYARQALNETLKILCARLAAYYSKAKNSENVPVDFTEIRFVRKPKGSSLGFVTYKNQKTLYVDPISIRQAKDILKTVNIQTKRM